jgi:hypothetical protein
VNKAGPNKLHDIDKKINLSAKIVNIGPKMTEKDRTTRDDSIFLFII